MLRTNRVRRKQELSLLDLQSLATGAQSTGNCISRRNREEIRGSFGRGGGAVRDVVGAGANYGAGSNSAAGSSACPRAG